VKPLMETQRTEKGIIDVGSVEAFIKIFKRKYNKPDVDHLFEVLKDLVDAYYKGR